MADRRESEARCGPDQDSDRHGLLDARREARNGEGVGQGGEKSWGKGGHRGGADTAAGFPPQHREEQEEQAGEIVLGSRGVL